MPNNTPRHATLLTKLNEIREQLNFAEARLPVALRVAEQHASFVYFSTVDNKITLLSKSPHHTTALLYALAAENLHLNHTYTDITNNALVSLYTTDGIAIYESISPEAARNAMS